MSRNEGIILVFTHKLFLSVSPEMNMYPSNPKLLANAGYLCIFLHSLCRNSSDLALFLSITYAITQRHKQQSASLPPYVVRNSMRLLHVLSS